MKALYVYKGAECRRLGMPRNANPYNFKTSHKGHWWDLGWAGLPS